MDPNEVAVEAINTMTQIIVAFLDAEDMHNDEGATLDKIHDLTIPYASMIGVTL